MASTSDGTLYSNEVKTLRSWIRTCQQEHKTCVAQGIGSVYPTRLLDLRNSSIRLIDGLDVMPSDGGYVALSYCWGSTMPESGKTTMETLEARRQGISFTLLPKSLREAITVTRSLGIPFLWIDALCIIQGDVVDWEKESATMSQVYSQAIVTLAAAFEDHCDGGFIKPQRVGFVERLKIGSIQERYQQGLPNAWTDNPLARRGWALQERELSTRVVHFTPLWIIWECREQCLSYYHMSRHRPRVVNVSHNKHMSCLRPTSGRCLDNSAYANYLKEKDPYNLWKELVMNYTKRKLTVPTDKIAALSGLVKAIQPLLNSEFVAGLWLDDILRGLMWERWSHEESHPPYSTYYAPSWSWLSANVPIHYYPGHKTDLEPQDRGLAFDHQRLEKTNIAEIAVQSDGQNLLPGGFIRLHTQVKSLLDAPSLGLELRFDDVRIHYGDITV